jgi:heat shock protein HslJ
MATLRPGLPALCLLLALTACGAPGGATLSPTPAPSAQDPSGSWQLTAGILGGAPIPILDDHPVTLTVVGPELSGTAACNSYGARLAVVGGRLEVGELGMTAMACEDAVMALEAAYIAALRAVRAIARDGDTLTLTGPGAEMTFARLEPPPTAELIGTSWVLESLFVGDVASPSRGEPATLVLRDDGTLSGATGCRTFDGRWVERANQIVATELRMNEVECPVGLADQDSHVVGVIGDGFVASIDGDLLTLVDPGDVGLVYRAEE